MYKVMLARFPGNNQEHPDSSGYYIGLMEKLMIDEKVSMIVPWRLGDTPITMSRNRCVKNALDAKCDYIIMIDSDMSPDCEPDGKPFWDVAWAFLMERRKQEGEYREELYRAETGSPPSETPVEKLEKQVRFKFPPGTIAAPYCGPPPKELPYIFRWRNRETNDPNPDFTLEMFTREEAAERTGIEEVAALPTGLIIYDARVFQTLPAPWYDYEWKDEPYRTEKASTEDVFQTRNASLCGLPQYVAWDSWAAHLKIKKVGKPQLFQISSIRRTFANAVREFDEHETKKDAALR